MKYFLTLFVVGLLSFFSAAQNVAGTWVWVGAGCRDSSLSQDSHITKSSSENPFEIDASQLNLYEDGSASMLIETNEETQNETGRYVVRNNQVIITDPGSFGTDPVLILDIVGDTLILSNRSLPSEEGYEEEDSRHFNQVCRGSDLFVYIFGNVD